MGLVVALGGTSYAVVKLSKNSVGSKQIKRSAVKKAELADSAVTSPKVEDGSLLGTDFAAGQLPTQGITTLTTRVSTVSAPVGSSDVTAPCQAGERAVGGGGLFTNDEPEITIQQSHPAPTGNNSTPTGWTVRYEVAGIPHEVSVQVICASP